MQRFAAQKKSLLTGKKTQLSGSITSTKLSVSLRHSAIFPAADCAEPVLVSCLV